MFKSVNKFRYLGLEDFPHGFFDLLEHRTGRYLLKHVWYLSVKLSVAVNRLGLGLSSVSVIIYLGCYGETRAFMHLIHTAKMKVAIYQLQVQQFC